MGDPHGRYEELAVGHVLGGLSSSQSAELREHLHACRICRSRVAELRGIADDLAVAAREERARVRVRTEEPPASDHDDPGPRDPIDPEARQRVRSERLIAAVLALLAVTVGLAFWNLHLRTAAASYLEVVADQSDALARLAEGVELAPRFASDVGGRVVTDGEQVTVTLTGLEPMADGERLVAWLRQASGPREPSPMILAGPGQPRDGSLACSLQIDDARDLLVTREAVLRPTEPRGEPILEVTLVRERP